MTEHIGSVYVEVLPDADRFAERFRAKALPQIDALGKELGDRFAQRFTESVERQLPQVFPRTRTRTRQQSEQSGREAGDAFGRQLDSRIEAAIKALPKIRVQADTSEVDRKMSLIRGVLEGLKEGGNLRVGLDDKQVLSRLSLMQADLRELTGPAHDVRIRVDAAAAMAELAAIKAAVAKLDEHVPGADPKSTEDLTKNLPGLFSLLFTLAPAITPLAGAAAAGGSALVAMGVGGVLAIKSITAEEKAGTPVGRQYAAGLASMKLEAKDLQSTVAKGLLPAFEQTRSTLQKLEPQARSTLSGLSTQIGGIIGHLIGGGVGGLQTFEPLLSHILTDADHLAERFEAWATGPGGAKFADTLQKDFDAVGPVLGDTAQLIEKIVAASNGPGIGLLSTFDLFVRGLNVFPVGVWQALITGFVTLKTLTTVDALFHNWSASLGTYTREELAAAAATRELTAAQRQQALSGEAAAESNALAGAAAQRGGLRGKLGGAVGFGGKLATGYLGLLLGSQFADQATHGWQTAQNGGEFFAGNVAHTVNNIVTGHWGNIVGDIRRNQAERDEIEAMQQGARYATLPSGLNLSIFGTNVLRGAANDRYAGGTLSALGPVPRPFILPPGGPTVSLPSRFLRHPASGIASGVGTPGAAAIAGAASAQQEAAALAHAASAAGAARGALTGLTNAEVSAGVAGRQVAATQHALAYGFQQVRLNTGHQDINTARQTYDQLTQSLQKNVEQRSKWLDQGGKTIITLKGTAVGENTMRAALAETGNDYVKAIGLIRGRITALADSKSAVASAQADEQRLSDAVTTAGAKYGLTEQQVAQYAITLGISSDAVAQGNIDTETFARAIGHVKAELDNGPPSFQAWDAAAQQFNQAGNTAASRANLIGAALVSFNGDAIQYGNTMVQAATANQQLVTDLRNVHRGVINLKTGFIDYHNAGAAPVLSDLAQLQQSAMNAAAATYQLEVSHKGAKQAAADAADVFHNDTTVALEHEFEQMGKTKQEADALATRYFNWPKNAKTQIEALGAKDTNTILEGIGRQLGYISGHPWTLNVGANLSANAKKVLDLGGGVYRVGGSGGANVHLTAAGGEITGGIPGKDSVHILAMPKEIVVNAKQAQKHRNLLLGINAGMDVPGYASGGEVGGFTGVDYSPGGVDKNGNPKGGSKAAKNPFDWSAVTSFLSAIGITTNAFTQAKNGLLAALRQQKVSSDQLARVTRESNRLISDAKAIATETQRISTAQQYLAGLRQQAAQERSSVANSFMGFLDLSQAGVKQQVYNDQPAGPVTASSILASITGAANKGVNAKNQLAKLKGKIPNSLYQQLAENATSDTDQIAALAGASSADLSAIGKQYNRLARAGKSAGGAVADQLFGSKIDTANALLNGFDPKKNPALAAAVNRLSTQLFGAGKETAKGLAMGLKSEKSTLVGAMHDLAHTLESTIRKDLGIKSPSRVMHEIGKFSGEGLANGIIAKLPAVRAATSRLSNEVMFDPRTVSAGGATGGAVYQVHGYGAAEVAAAIERREDHKRRRAVFG